MDKFKIKNLQLLFFTGHVTLLSNALLIESIRKKYKFFIRSTDGKYLFTLAGVPEKNIFNKVNTQ